MNRVVYGTLSFWVGLAAGLAHGWTGAAIAFAGCMALEICAHVWPVHE